MQISLRASFKRTEPYRTPDEEDEEVKSTKADNSEGERRFKTGIVIIFGLVIVILAIIPVVVVTMLLTEGV